uniref:G protein-coupled receptor n=2 Tax=Bursaphelenchus xylophilus TaxID=6326 RepID=A0A1I7RJY3_BURXY
MAATTILFVVIERISASLWLECYERREDKFLIHAMLAFALLVSVVFYSINYAYDLRIFAYRLPYVFIALVAFVSLVVFLYFHFLNKRRLRQALANRSFYSLNERFQLAENVRVGDIAIRQAFIVSGMVMLFVTAVVIISCLNLDIPLYILRSLSYHFLAIYNIAEAFNIAYGHSTFKKLYFDQLRRSLFGPKGSVDSIDATKRHSIRNTDGMVLNFSAREENRIVFTMLENSWR